MEPLTIKSSPRRRLLDHLPLALRQALVRNGVRPKSSPGLPDGFFRLKVDRTPPIIPAGEDRLDEFPGGITPEILQAGDWTEPPERSEANLIQEPNGETLVYVHDVDDLTGIYGCVRWGRQQALPLAPADLFELRALARLLGPGGLKPRTLYVAAGRCLDVGEWLLLAPTVIDGQQVGSFFPAGYRLGGIGIQAPALPGLVAMVYVVEGGEAALRAHLAQNP